MKKFLKYGLLAIAGVFVVVIAGTAYIVATFDPNAYRPQIIEAVKKHTQRTLKLEGDIKLKLFPRIGASLGKASISEHASDQEFASLERAQVSLELWPLFSRHLVVNRVSVSGASVHLIKRRDGTLNIDDLLPKPAAPAEPAAPGGARAAVPVVFDIESVSVDKSDVSYRDEATGADYAVKDLTLTTGRVAERVPGTVDVSARLEASQPKLDLTAHLKAGLVFDLAQNAYELTNLAADAKGGALGIDNLAASAAGSATANLNTQEFGLQKFSASASGSLAKNRFDVTLEAPRLDLTRSTFSAGQLAIGAKLDGALGKVTANVTVPGVEGNRQSFKISALTLDADVAQPEQTFGMKLSTPVAGNIETLQFSLPAVTLAVNAKGEKLPNKSVSSEMKGNAKADLRKQTVTLKLAGGLLQSKVAADVAVSGFAKPAIRFNVDVDQFDADLYLPKKHTEGGAAKPAAAEPEQPFDLSALRPLDLNGSLRVGALKAANVKASQLRVDVRAHGGVVNLNPLSANLYQGAVRGAVTVNAAQATPSFGINAVLSGVEVGPLAKDAANFDFLEGRGNVTLALSTQGDRVSALKQRLNGSAAVNLANGAIKGINLAKLVEGVQSLGKGASMQTLGVNKDEKTPFSEFRATLKVRDGVAHNDDLSVRSAVLHVTGNGDIDVGHDRLNYNAKAAFSKTEQGRAITLPVNVSGAFDALKFRVDYGAMITEIAKQKVQEKTEELKSKALEGAKGKLQEQLKGLFK